MNLIYSTRQIMCLLSTIHLQRNFTCAQNLWQYLAFAANDLLLLICSCQTCTWTHYRNSETINQEEEACEKPELNLRQKILCSFWTVSGNSHWYEKNTQTPHRKASTIVVLGIEPRFFLLWGDSANHYTTIHIPPTCTYSVFLSPILLTKLSVA